MTITEKKAKISNIQSTDNALVLLERIIKKAGLGTVVRHEKGYLTAIEKTPFSTRNLSFFPTIQHLNGKNSEIHTKLDQTDCSKFDEIYVVSTYRKPISKYYREKIEERFQKLNFGYWNSDDLIDKIDSLASDYWTHSDTFIKPYEESFLITVAEDFELKRLKLDDKYIKMLNIFIEPRLSILYNDDDDENLVFSKSFQRKKMIHSGNFIISGGAGTGKSTLQKQIAKEVIEGNLQAVKKTLPIILKQADIINNDGQLIEAIDQQLLKTFQKYDLRKVFKDYKILLLIDSIDEFNTDKRQAIIKDIEELQSDYDVRYIIATRDRSYLLHNIEIEENFERITLENFNLSQSKLFLEHFFQFDQNKSNRLLESLTSNKILDKLAVTPLTLSLISILFEEKQYEIPATITDIYDNFKMILLGRAHVKSSLEFLDINIKERLLSLYALEILKTEEKKPKTISEFETFVGNFLKSKSSVYDESTLPDVLKYFTKEIDILFIENNKYVKFKHSSFMEYFAATEIFKYQRNLEDTLTQAFTDLNWQNTAIFYGGHSKDMKGFLQKVTNQTTTYSSLSDLLVSNIGLGYLLQALYLTDEDSRKESILVALDLNAKILDKITLLASERATFFEDMKMHTVATLCTIQFLQNYSSFTLKGALIKAYEELKKEYEKCIAEKNPKAKSLGYKLFNIAVALHSDKINDQSKIEDLFDVKNI